ncbi:diguanylate cyclase [Acidaminobacter sp. JC074]|uniref:sensor domain-containing diguanylate cyclase n=1 Tax=Acidaminobacter sp. JC074 TaxID=2530199 RepID=UPI001F0EF8BD|nr:diguanylate cyclase [Acidaminobacter sp. JC074]MCH4886571.1 diguanylate cyclase [Acidaminobacter sp. JC074]
MFTSIRSRHNFIINVYVLVLVVIILFLVTLAGLEFLSDFQREHQLNTTIAYANEFSIIISEIESLLRIEKNIILDNPTDYRIQVDAMRRITTEFDFIINMSFVRSDKVILSSNNDMPLFDADLVDYSFSDLLITGPYLHDEYGLLTTLSLPVVRDETELGYLTAYVDLNALREYLIMPQTFGLTSAILLNTEGWVLSSSDYLIEELENVREYDSILSTEIDEWLHLMKTDDFGAYMFEYEDVDYKLTYAQVDNTPGWFVVITMEEEDYEELYEDFKMLIFILFILIFAVTVGLSRLVVNLIVKPIIDLTNASEKKEIALISKTVEKRNDEVTRLFKTYNEMISDLKAQSEDLERQVEERTKDLKDANDRLYNLATTDSLTGSMNRMQIVSELESIIFNIKDYKNASVAVLFIDLNNFKYYNDTFGHDIGDLILIEVIQFLRRQVRASDFIGRYGGDEFIILLPSAKHGVLPRIIKTIQDALETEKHFKPLLEEWLGREVDIPTGKKLGLSIGKSIYEAGDIKDVETIIKEADEDMYIEKEKSKKRS